MKLWVCILALVCPLLAEQKVYRIMPVGDSITEGGSTFANWRLPLWEKLYTAGYLVEYVGSRSSRSRIGELKHEGYGGKNSGFLAATVPANFRQHPADIVLLHAGHNHFADQKPVPGILADTEKLIEGFRAVKPEVTVLLAQPITSGKLPKYSYIPELHRGLARLAARLDRPDARVVIVPQAEGFDPRSDTVADLVHPNESGAAKMAQRWFEALVQVMKKPPVSYHPRIVPYKKSAKGDLTLHVFSPVGKPSAPRPAIVFFFGGGWKQGTPLQFYQECHRLSGMGYVAMSADYRTASTHGTSPFEAVADAKSAIRWVRQHAAELGIDPRRVTAGGASAGGHLAAAAGTLPGFDEPDEDGSVSARPDSLLLLYPVIDNGPGGYGEPAVKARFKEFSPLHLAGAGTPPAFIMTGTKDQLVPVASIRAFQEKLTAAGVRCEVDWIEGGGHPLYFYQKGPSPLRDRFIEKSVRFLGSRPAGS